MRDLIIIDDNIMLLRVLKMILSEHFNVKEFSKPTDAVKYMEENPSAIDIVISDFKMPMMNGIEVLTKVTQIRPESIRFILTGYSDNDVIASNKNVYNKVLDKNHYKEAEQFVQLIEEFTV